MTKEQLEKAFDMALLMLEAVSIAESYDEVIKITRTNGVPNDYNDWKDWCLNYETKI